MTIVIAARSRRVWLKLRPFVLGAVFAFNAMTGSAQMPNPYGAPISIEAAKRVAAPAIAEARKNNWNVAVAVVDGGGHLVYFERVDNTQAASSNVAIAKARSAALFKRPTKAFQDVLAAGGSGLRILGLPDAVPLEGGLPLIMDGKIVGAVGVSGDTSEHDAICAKSGADALGRP
jgi:glc operon protein GlcG